MAAASFYPRHEVLTGRTATRSRFMDAAGGFDVVHFGGHAIVNAEPAAVASGLLAGSRGRVRSRCSLTRSRSVVLAHASRGARCLRMGIGGP